jgi:predicted CopG family antitoxin
MTITKLKRIAVHEGVYEQLRDIGKTRDSFNDIIVKMLKIRGEDEKLKLIQKIA